MNLPIPAPVTILEKPYSMLDLARHVTSKERRYNRTAEDARSGVRLVAALEKARPSGAEVADEDLRKFAAVIEQPNCGWGIHDVSIQYPDPRDGSPKTLTRKAHGPTAEYLPLIDAVANAAKALPSLASPPAK